MPDDEAVEAVEAPVEVADAPAPKKKAAKKSAAKKPVDAPAPKEVEVATEVEPAELKAAKTTDSAQAKMVASREYGEKIRRESIARNHARRAEAQKAQTLRPPT